MSREFTLLFDLVWPFALDVVRVAIRSLSSVNKRSNF